MFWGTVSPMASHLQLPPVLVNSLAKYKIVAFEYLFYFNLAVLELCLPCKLLLHEH